MRHAQHPAWHRIVLVGSLASLISLVGYVPAIIAAMPENDQSLLKVDLKNKLVLSEDPYNNFLSRSTPAMIDCAVFTSIWKDHPDKLGQIVERIGRKEYAAVVINCQDSEDKEKYFGRMWFYRPFELTIKNPATQW